MTRYQPDDSVANAKAFQIGVAVPGPLSARLDVLVDIARRAGERTTRKELVAALILSATPTETSVRRMIRTYRRARVADAFILGEDPTRFLASERQRGPRPQPAQPPAPRRPGTPAEDS